MRPQKQLDMRLEEVLKAVGDGYCRLQIPLKLALGVRGTVAGRRLGALEVGGGRHLPPVQCIPRLPPKQTPDVALVSGCGGPLWSVSVVRALPLWFHRRHHRLDQLRVRRGSGVRGRVRRGLQRHRRCERRRRRRGPGQRVAVGSGRRCEAWQGGAPGAGARRAHPQRRAGPCRRRCAPSAPALGTQAHGRCTGQGCISRGFVRCLSPLRTA